MPIKIIISTKANRPNSLNTMAQGNRKTVSTAKMIYTSA